MAAKLSFCNEHLAQTIGICTFNEGTLIQIVPPNDMCCEPCRYVATHLHLATHPRPL